MNVPIYVSIERAQKVNSKLTADANKILEKFMAIEGLALFTRSEYTLESARKAAPNIVRDELFQKIYESRSLLSITTDSPILPTDPQTWKNMAAILEPLIYTRDLMKEVTQLLANCTRFIKRYYKKDNADILEVLKMIKTHVSQVTHYYTFQISVGNRFRESVDIKTLFDFMENSPDTMRHIKLISDEATLLEVVQYIGNDTEHSAQFIEYITDHTPLTPDSILATAILHNMKDPAYTCLEIFDIKEFEDFFPRCMPLTSNKALPFFNNAIELGITMATYPIMDKTGLSLRDLAKMHFNKESEKEDLFRRLHTHIPLIPSFDYVLFSNLYAGNSYGIIEYYVKEMGLSVGVANHFLLREMIHDGESYKNIKRIIDLYEEEDLPQIVKTLVFQCVYGMLDIEKESAQAILSTKFDQYKKATKNSLRYRPTYTKSGKSIFPGSQLWKIFALIDKLGLIGHVETMCKKDLNPSITY